MTAVDATPSCPALASALNSVVSEVAYESPALDDRHERRRPAGTRLLSPGKAGVARQRRVLAPIVQLERLMVGSGDARYRR